MSKSKGRRTVNKAIQHLTDEGYIVDEVELGGKFRESRDLFAGYCTLCFNKKCKHKTSYRFEGFDLVALSSSKICLIQVKTNKPPTQKNYIAFAKKFASDVVKVIAMTWYDRKGWVIHTFNKNGKVNRKDLRKSNDKIPKQKRN